MTLAGGVVKVDLADGNDFLDASQSTSSGNGLVGYGGSGNDTLERQEQISWSVAEALTASPVAQGSIYYAEVFKKTCFLEGWAMI